MRRGFRLFRRNEDGAAAIEFAFVAPILITLHLGTVELVQAWEAQRRAAHIASALADLTAQNRIVTAADLDDIMRAGPILIAPSPSSGLGLRITSLVADSSGRVSPDWTVSSNYTSGGSASVPAGFLAANQSVIVADVSYRYNSLFALILPRSLVIQRRAYATPRLSNQVTKS